MLRVRSDGECEIDAPAGRCLLGPQTLPVLGAFATPRTAQQAIALLEPQLAGRRGAVDLLGTIVQLVRAGALEPEGDHARFAGDAEREGFGALPIHVAMLDDAVRTEAWLAAVGRIVRTDDIVVDVGSGTGILAIAAARAGARRVYAIEATASAGVARAMAAANGVADRVTVIRGWSTLVELPERATVLVSEVLGDDPFREGVLETMADATRRLLAPDARIIPRRVRVLATPVEVDAADREREIVTPASIARWNERHGLDFSPLVDAMTPGTVASVAAKRAGAWRRLGEPTLVVDIELGPHSPEHFEVDARLKATRAGVCHGIVLHFEAELTDELVVSTDPACPGSASHWMNPTLFAACPRPLAIGDQLTLRYRYPGAPSAEISV